MAQAILAEFVSLSLVQQVHNGRYRLHPLLREYAREKIRDERPYNRMVRYYIQHAVDHQHDYPLLAQEFTNISAARKRPLPTNWMTTSYLESASWPPIGNYVAFTNFATNS